MIPSQWYCGIGLVVRIPLDLLAPDDAPVDQRRHLPVAAAEVEADAAALEVPAQTAVLERSGGRSLVATTSMGRS